MTWSLRHCAELLDVLACSGTSQFSAVEHFKEYLRDSGMLARSCLATLLS